MRQRRDLAGEIDRAAAGGIAARAALQPADPVNPGKSDQSPDQDRADRQAESAAWRAIGAGTFQAYRLSSCIRYGYAVPITTVGTGTAFRRLRAIESKT